MEIKERLDLLKAQEQDINENTLDMSLFCRNEEAEKIIKSVINSHKNIIAVSGVHIDRNLLINYIKTFIDDNNKISEINDLRYIAKTSLNSRKIVYNSDIKKALKIFECILNGYGDFIFSIPVKKYENIIESLKTLISLNASNITSEGINNLLGLSDSVIIFFDKNTDGLITVNNIGEILYDNSILQLKNLYNSLNDLFELADETETLENSDNTTDISDENEKQSQKNSLENFFEQNNDTLQSEIKIEKKINKYKLLREKLKNKNHT